MNQVLIHANLAKGKFELDSEEMSGFTSQIESINNIGFSSPGFIEEPVLSDKGDIFPPPYVLNVTIWESVEFLKGFVYQGQHLQAIKDRANWFLEHDLPRYVLWWAPEGQVITERLVFEKLKTLKLNGPSLDAFTFSKVFCQNA